MPIYEFKCSGCDEVFEVLVLRPIDRKESCPNCGSAETEKLLSVTSSIISQGDLFAGCPMPCAAGAGQAGRGGCPMSGAGQGRRIPGSGMGGGCPMPPIA